MFAQIIIDIAHAKVDRLFTYRVPEGMQVETGQHVLVPFGRGNKPTEGFVLQTMPAVEETGYAIKPILRVLEPYAVLVDEQLQLATWMQEVYHCLLVDALRLMIPAQLRGARIQEKTVRTVCLPEGLDIDAARASFLKKDGSPRAPVQAEVFELLADAGAPLSTVEIEAFLPGSRSAVAALIKKGLLVEQGHVTFRRPLTGYVPEEKNITHNDAQQAAIETISAALPAGGQTFLLHGVTGSGKTEVYLESIARCIASNKQAILLVPEIALTPQTMGIFRARFGDDVAVLHSRLSAGERFDEWRRIRLGHAKVAIGARSAVFAPFQSIGLIIIDEEHEQSYQSEQTPRYHALEVARKRCAMHAATLVLGSATPSLQSYYRARTGVYQTLELPERVRALPMPEMEVVDMREEFRAGNNAIFSALLLERLHSCLRANKQAILFLNRRGYSTFVSCRNCGHVFECPNCDVSMTYHRTDERVRCHYCGYSEGLQAICPACGKPYVKYFGAGTQQVEEQLYEHFPHVRALRVDLDTTREKGAHERLFQAFRNGEAQVLIGTQMVAKGLDFPNVTLVGAVAADTTLHLPDYRAAERTFQLLMQVAGRAGRDDWPGKVVVQTYTPEHPSIAFAAAHDYKGFFAQELMQRRAALFPPFSLFVRALLTGEDEAALSRRGEKLGKELHAVVLSALAPGHEAELIYLSASPAPMHKRQGVYRYQVLIKLLRTKRTAAVLRAIYTHIDTVAGEQFVTVEINPGDLF
ncbi:primosomal protein N' [Christensenellaceae bacterium OttesenSCG-928-L17]|nr:primosomal protein N' [Christensenellaceae bacterium OttesenSCG-928-L17]